MERVKGIEPSSLAWKARALPLSYTRLFFYFCLLHFFDQIAKYQLSPLCLHFIGYHIKILLGYFKKAKPKNKTPCFFIPRLYYSYIILFY